MRMERFVFSTQKELGQAAAEAAAKDIGAAIQSRGQANIILATGASQFSTLEHLVAHKEIDFSAVVMFHLDEYIGLSIEHPASFRKYLKERFVDRLDSLMAYHFVNGDVPDPTAECHRLKGLIQAHPIDVALVGIGENGHLAFNDPPADFETQEPYLIVELDEKCRRQQLGEGWFPTLEDVPHKAISMSIQQILKSQSIIVSVPDRRKAEAVKGAVEDSVTNLCPSSILQQHPNCRMYLDTESASLLTSCD